MKSPESLKEFYEEKKHPIPDALYQKIGHFNLFNLEPIPKGTTRQLPYRRRDYYKVMLVEGNINFHYADKSVGIINQALVFSNPQIPYQCEHLDRIKGGFYAIFNHQFFKDFGRLDKYGVFQPKGNKVFELDDKQRDYILTVYKKMFDDFQSDYIHKYDALANHIYEILHFAMKMQPSSHMDKSDMNASQRIAALFLELLERQFPINENHTQILQRSASEFAAQLNVHVNHLNRALKEATGKSTSQLIADRILQESKNLLTNSIMNVSDISYALGFSEPSHFNNFFKKFEEQSPTKYRSEAIL